MTAADPGVVGRPAPGRRSGWWAQRAAARVLRSQTLRDRLAMLALIVVTWRLLGYLFGTRYLGTPLRTLERFVELVQLGATWSDLRWTTYEALYGLVLGTVAAGVAGFVAAVFPSIGTAVQPLVSAFLGAPKIAFIPALILFFGIGPSSKVALVSFVVFFFVYATTYSGLRLVDGRLRVTAALFGTTRWQWCRMICWPAGRRYLLDGVRLALPYAFLSAIGGEIALSNKGIGHQVRDAATYLDVDTTFALLLLTMSMAMAVDAILDRLFATRAVDPTVDGDSSGGRPALSHAST